MTEATTTTQTVEKKGSRLLHLVVGYACLLGGIIFLIMSLGSGSSLVPGGKDYVRDIPYYARMYVRYGKVKGFKDDHGAHWRAMQKQTSYMEAHRDAFATYDAIVEEDESELLKLTEKYSGVIDFLPAYFFNLSKANTDKIVAYAKANGNDQAISRLMKPADQTDAWPYRDALLKSIEKGVEYRAELAQEVWDSCGVSQDPELYVNVPGTGLIAKRQYLMNEDPATAGYLTKVVDRNGVVMLDELGMECLHRETYAREFRETDECLSREFDSELRPRYCFRPAQMQAVVRSGTKKPPLHKCGKDEEAGFLDKAERIFASGASAITGGDGPAAPPGVSNHQWPGAIDLNNPKSHLRKCLPPYFEELKGDPGHYDTAKVEKPKDGYCTEVRLSVGKRRFCFNKEDSASSAHPLAGLRRVTNKEISGKPDVNKRAAEIISEHNKDPINTQIPFEAHGEEFICVIEWHYGKDPRRMLRGKPMGKHKGCSVYVRAEPEPE